MAIDRTGISSLQTGAPEITYTGDEGPKSPDQMLMASADPMLVDEYNKYVFELKEIRPEATPMSFRDFVEQVMAEARQGGAGGGIMRLGYASGQLVKSGPGRPGYQGPLYAAGPSQGPAGGQTMTGGGSDQFSQASAAPIGGHHGGGGQDVMPVSLPSGHPEAIAKQSEQATQQLLSPEGTERALREFEALKEPPLPPMGGGEGLASMGPTPAEIEAMRIRQLLALQTQEKLAADEKVATIKEQEEEDAFLASLTRDYDFEDLQYADDRGLMYAAGGRVPAAYGGLMGNDGRRAYGLGSFFKSVTKPFKKAAKTIKKVAKSPIGKLALGYLATAGLGNLAAGGGNWSRFIGSATKPGWLRPSQVLSNIGGMFPGSDKVKYTTEQLVDLEFDKLKLKFPDADKFKLYEHAKKLIDTQGTTGGLGKTAMKAAAFGLPALALAYPKFGETPGLSMTDATGANKAAADAWAQTHLKGLDEEDWQLTSGSELTPLEYAAQGGRIGYKKGGDHTDRQLALNTLYGIRTEAQEGGLMDLGGMEKDYREEGGFVPIGGQERADDVPARLSKNEFVFTADAVRSAGGGDIDAGAEVMENVMNNLEQGGQISEESQGLEGARNMFATAQRLEGVL